MHVFDYISVKQRQLPDQHVDFLSSGYNFWWQDRPITLVNQYVIIMIKQNVVISCQDMVTGIHMKIKLYH